MRTIPKQTKSLTATESAVLGLLTRGARSGYDLHKDAAASVGYVWAPAKSQIYAVLPRLVAAGYATRRGVAQEQRPDKQVYSVTAAGEAALREWLLESPRSNDEFLLKVFFGDLMPPAALVALVERRRAEAQETLSEYRAIERRIAGEERDYHGYLTLRWGLVHVAATIRWCDGVLRELARGGASTA